MDLKVDYEKNKIINANSWPNQPRFGRLQKQEG